MAASDQTYRNQKALHVVFAASSVVMLVTTGWMFWDDYNRPFKTEQRVFRDVEEELAKRATLRANRKAVFDSVTSFYNIAVELHGADSAEARRYLAEMDKARQQLDQ